MWAKVCQGSPEDDGEKLVGDNVFTDVYGTREVVLWFYT